MTQDKTPESNVIDLSAQQARPSPMRLMAAMAALGVGCLPEVKSRPEPPQKPCLHCGKMKQHNNSFCSADCCRAYRKKGR